MLKKAVFSTIFGILALAAALIVWQPSLSRAQTSDCASADYTGARGMLDQAQTALTAGDVITAIQLEADARAELRGIFNDCAVAPLLREQGLDDAAIAAVAEMPFCEYRFEATVRAGSNAGLALLGRLALMQNSPTTAVGYVYSLDETAAPVPVLMEIGEDTAVTLTFKVSDEATIVGTGYFTSSIATCFGGVEGVFTGPGADDVGDWIGLPCTLNSNSLSCTPTVSLDPSKLPVLQPSKPVKPEPEPGSPPICTPIRDAACVAACGFDFDCFLDCPTVGEMCS